MTLKNFFNKMKTYSFWVSFSGALIIFFNALGRLFGFEIENQVVEDCVMSIAGILVVLGVVTMGDKTQDDDESSLQDQLSQDDEEKDDKEEVDDQIDNDVDKTNKE